MMLRLLLLFTIVPAVELFLLLQLGSWLGPTATFLIILLTGVLGAALAKREGLGVLRELQGELQQGLPPGSRLMEGVLVVVGGLLLVTPGVFTDLTGFLLIFPWSRRWLAPRVLKYLASRFEVKTLGPGFGPVGADEEPDVRHRDPARPRQRAGHNPFANPFDDL